MRLNRSLLSFGLVAALGSVAAGQRVIPLYSGVAPGSESWTQQESRYISKEWDMPIVVNVVRPTLTAFLPAADKANGTSVVICPGGGFYALSIDNEGNDLAQWLTARGIAAFVLKYRLVKSGDDAVMEFMTSVATGTFDAATSRVIPLAVDDARAAVAYVRSHARELNISPDRVGLAGFSAGGTLVAGVAFHHDSTSRPAFLASMYAYTGGITMGDVPADAPPLFIVGASDDQLGLAPASVDLYSRWLKAKKPVELHMYSVGGHGFGMHKQGTPSDGWIDRFGDWLVLRGLMKKP